MTSAQIHAHSAPNAPGKGNTRAGVSEARQQAKNGTNEAKEAAARRAVVGVARLAWVNTTFGVALPCRKYMLADEAQAAELDQLFYRLTGTRP